MNIVLQFHWIKGYKKNTHLLPDIRPCYKHRYMFVALFCLSRAVFFKNRK